MSNFQKNSKDYGEPDITYQLAGAAEQRPTMPRIPGIGAGNRPSDLGFQESEATLPQNEAGFQESKLETGAAQSAIWQSKPFSPNNT